MLNMRTLVKCEIQCICKNSENLRLEFDETIDSIFIKAYVKDEISGSFLLRGDAIEILKNGEGFKSGNAFKKLSADEKSKLITLACFYCDINAGRGQYHGSGWNCSNSTSTNSERTI